MYTCMCECVICEDMYSQTHSRVLILVDDRVIDDAFRPVSISESRQTLLIVVGGGAHRGNHHRLTVATQVILGGGVTR